MNIQMREFKEDLAQTEAPDTDKMDQIRELLHGEFRREAPALAEATGPLHPHILASETARVQLQMLTNFLMLWQAEDTTGLIARKFG